MPIREKARRAILRSWTRPRRSRVLRWGLVATAWLVPNLGFTFLIKAMPCCTPSYEGCVCVGDVLTGMYWITVAPLSLLFSLWAGFHWHSAREGKRVRRERSFERALTAWAILVVLTTVVLVGLASLG